MSIDQLSKAQALSPNFAANFSLNDRAQGYDTFSRALIEGDLAALKVKLDDGYDVNYSPQNTLYSAMNIAVAMGNLEAIQLFIDNGFKFKHRSIGYDELTTSIRNNQLESYKLLIKNGLKLNENNVNKRLDIAVFSGSVEMVNYFLSEGDDPNDFNTINFESSLDHLAKLTDPDKITEICKLLLVHGAKVSGVNPFSDPIHSSIKRSNLILLKLILGKYPSHLKEEAIDHAYFNAIFSGKDDVGMMLIGLGANKKERNGHFPFIIAAASKGCYRTVKFLADRGEDVNIKHKSVSPLIKAIEAKDARMVNLLISLGADVNQTNKTNPINNLDKDDPPLWRAIFNAKSYSLEIIRIIINSGANLAYFNAEGETVLMRCVLNEDLETSMLLIESGANLLHKRNDGLTMMDAAIINGKKFTAMIEQQYLNIAIHSDSSAEPQASKKSNLKIRL